MIKNKGEILEYLPIIIFLILIIVFFGGMLFTNIIKYTNEQEIEILVKDKYVKNNSKGNDKYLIVDENNNTYEITDLFFKGKWNSTDLYNQLENNKKYKIKTTGKRIQFFSMYPNINNVEKVEEINK